MAKPSKPKPSEVLNALRGSWRGSPHELDKVFQEILNEMLTLHYPPFRAEDDDELLEMAAVALRAYAEELAPFDRIALSRAWREVLKDHKTERWPVLGVILDACRASAPSGSRASAPGSDNCRPATAEELEIFVELGYPRTMLRPSERPGLIEQYRRKTGHGSPAERRQANDRSWAEMSDGERGDMDARIKAAKAALAGGTLNRVPLARGERSRVTTPSRMLPPPEDWEGLPS